MDQTYQQPASHRLTTSLTAAVGRLQELVFQPNGRFSNNSLWQRKLCVLRDEAVKQAFYNTPAALLQRYQQIMQRRGRDLNAAFPEGTWQFYINYALREDTARHACETLGFQQALIQQRIPLAPVDRITTWVLTAVDCLHHYPRLLENEWRERMYTHLLSEISYNPQHADIYRRWERQRPFTALHSRTPNADYITFRKNRFDQFLSAVLASLPDPTRRDWQAAVRKAEAEDLPKYQKQLNILSYLHPGQFEEERIPISIEDAKIGLIIRGHYYTVPVCRFGTNQPVGVEEIRNAIAAILENPHGTPPTPVSQVVQVRRLAMINQLPKFSKSFQQAWKQIDQTPIWLNFDTENKGQPLAFLRQGERALGNHPLTIFDNGKSAVFDLSHIFFDGIWGVTLAEILTNQAVVWAKRLIDIPHTPAFAKRPSPLRLELSDEEQGWIAKAPKVGVEASAESDRIDLPKLQALRRLFKQKADFVELTVNDILILYRMIHHTKSFKLKETLRSRLKNLLENPEKVTAVKATLAEFPEKAAEDNATFNPAVLIPVDASRRSPRDRVYPMTFDFDLGKLNLEQLHKETLVALTVLERSVKNRDAAFKQFMIYQDDYLRALSIGGQLLSRSKRMAVGGKSLSIDSIKLLANLPVPVQRFLDKIPNQFDAINDIVKGREVFSNVGAVVSSSSLHRFITAKDDNEKKELAWGVLTDADGVMRVTLRDFRPHIEQLQQVGEFDTAVNITQDYLDSYVDGFNQFVADLLRIFNFIRRPDDRNQERPLPQSGGFWDFLKDKRLWLLAVPVLFALGMGFIFMNRDGTNAQTLPTQTAPVAVAIEPTETAVPTDVPTERPLPAPTNTAEPTLAPTLVPSSTPVPFANEPIIREADGMPMVQLPSGTFQMGAAESDALAQEDEKPRHLVTIPSFFIDQHEVTVSQYVAFLNELGGYVDSCLGYTCLFTRTETDQSHIVAVLNGEYEAESGFGAMPVNHVSWHGAKAYCESVNGRLPTEAEWEYAAGGSDGLLYPWGNGEASGETAVFNTTFTNLRPTIALPAGQSPFGLYNMAGGVAEWVNDTYDPFYYVFSPSDNPQGLAPDLRLPRGVRGGSFLSPAADLRITARRTGSPTNVSNTADIGFRCARNAQ